MPSTRVITCHANGSMEFTRFSGFDPAPGRDRNVERMSEILFDRDHQKYYIKLLKGSWAGRDDTMLLATLYNVYIPEWATVARPVSSVVAPPRRVYFQTYEQAVDFEVKLIDAMRLSGETFI